MIKTEWQLFNLFQYETEMAKCLDKVKCRALYANILRTIKIIYDRKKLFVREHKENCSVATSWFIDFLYQEYIL